MLQKEGGVEKEQGEQCHPPQSHGVSEEGPAVRSFSCASFKKRTHSQLTLGGGSILLLLLLFSPCRISRSIFSLRKLAVSCGKSQV